MNHMYIKGESTPFTIFFFTFHLVSPSVTLTLCLVVNEEGERNEKRKGRERERRERRKYFPLVCLDLGKKKERSKF